MCVCMCVCVCVCVCLYVCECKNLTQITIRTEVFC